MRRSINAIAGKGDQNLSSALESLPDVHVRFATNNENEYLLVTDSDNTRTKKVLRRKSNTAHELDRQLSTINNKTDQFQVK
jgi:hypothetical protein